MECHILLIEDERRVRRSMARVLEAKGHTVTTASGGAEALEHMRSIEELDIILLDLMMPDLNGWDVREKQLEEGLLPDVPLVILSGVNADLSEEQSALEATSYLSKPVRPAQLYETLETHCAPDD